MAQMNGTGPMTSNQTVTVFGAYGHTGRFVVSELRKRGWTPILSGRDMNQYAVSMEANPLVAIRADLQRWSGPARMVWGLKDSLFGVEWAEWLDRTLPGSRGVRRVEGANLFFPEEMPGLIAEEATRLWDIPRHTRTGLVQ